MSELYTILINDDHSFTHTNKKRIMQGSNLIDKIRFLVKPTYGDLDMTVTNVVLQYITPISRTYRTVILKPEAELYKNRVQYVLPIGIKMTQETGDLGLTINFSYLEMTEDDAFLEHVRTIGDTYIHIYETPRWSEYIPSADLGSIAEIMLMNQAIAEQNRVNIEMMQGTIPTGLEIDTKDNTLHLINEDGTKFGKAVSVDELGDCDCEDGVPVVELTVVEPEAPEGLVDNVVEI